MTLVKSSSAVVANANGKVKLGTQGGLHNRLRGASSSSIKANRIGFLLDVSGSMNSHDSWSNVNSPTRLESLKKAVGAFSNSCDWDDTSVSVETFPRQLQMESPLRILFEMGIDALCASGGTPMDSAMEAMLAGHSSTRCILISDGQANNPEYVIAQAHAYARAEIKIDCIHIGPSEDGEETLREVARITGGLYIKFSDSTQLARSLQWLSPRAYESLSYASVSEIKALLGASSVTR